MPLLRKLRSARLNSVSAIAGGVLLGIGCLWLISLLAFHRNSSSVTLSMFSSTAPVGSPEIQAPPLQAEGITLLHADQRAALGQQQALTLAAQYEPDAAAKAKSTVVRYVLLDYLAANGAKSHPDFNNTPVWMVWYQKIPLQPGDAAADPTPFPSSTHDLYVFLDANSGDEVLSVWV